jgi:O-acetyl-ADP-ribose deacetylase
VDIRRSATLSRQGCESLAYLGAILEEATGISAKASEGGGLLTPRGDPYFPGVAVKFPGGQVRAADRVGMWVDGDHVRLAMWPAELMPQYTRVYSDPKKVEALIELENHAGWTLQANFQLAHRFAQPLQRWYPCRHLSGQEYVNQWIDDFHEGCAGGRTIDEIADPRFFDWLVERSYAHDSERGSTSGVGEQQAISHPGTYTSGHRGISKLAICRRIRRGPQGWIRCGNSRGD